MGDDRAKPCQSCGSGMAVVVHKEGNPNSNYYYVLCGNCSSATQLHTTRQGAVKAWNIEWGETDMDELSC